MFIETGQYLPDLPDFNNPGMTVAHNVIPLSGGYGEVRDLAEISAALPSACLGAIYVKDNSGNPLLFAGTTDTISVMDNTLAFTDISDTAYGASNWEMAQYGTRMIFTSYEDNVRTYNIGADTIASALYTDLKTRYVGIVKDFVVYANTYDTVDLDQPKRVRWTGIGDPTTIDVSAITQSDFQNLEGSGVGGAITGFIGGEYGVIFQENAIWRMTYIGSPEVFQFDEVEKESGTRYGKSIAALGSTIIYLGKDGFKLFDGTVSTPIGAGKIDDTVFKDLDKAYSNLMSAAIDPVTKVYRLSYVSLNSLDKKPDKQIFYNLKTGTCGDASLSVEKLIPAFTTAYTLEELDAIDSNIDTFPLSFDSPAWQGGDFTLGAFSPNHKFGYFQGSALEGTLITGEYQPTDNGITLVDSIRLMAEGADATIQIGHRYSAERPVVYTAEIAPDSYGKYRFRTTNTLLRAKVNLYGGFRKVKGIDVQLVAGGSR